MPIQLRKNELDNKRKNLIKRIGELWIKTINRILFSA